MKDKFNQQNFVKLIAATTFIIMLVSAVIYKPNLLTVIPSFVSIFVLFMQSQVNRYAFLIGTFNSVLYGVAYILMGLYSMAANALLVSVPITFFTFLMWNKNTTNGQTKTKSLTILQRIAMFVSMAVVWIILFATFSILGSPYLVLDNTISVIGTASAILCAFRFAEFSLLNIISGVISIVLYIFMLKDDMSKISWLIFSCYSVTCSVISFINMIKKEKQQ